MKFHQKFQILICNFSVYEFQLNFSFLFAHETRAWTREQSFSGIRGSLSDDYLPYIFGYPLSANRQKDGTMVAIIKAICNF